MALKKSQVRATSLLPSDHHTVIRRDRLALGFTQSEISLWDECAEKWYLGYNHMLRRRGGYNWAFIYGDGLHDALDHHYQYNDGELYVPQLVFPDDVIPTPDEEFELRKWQGILAIQMKRYVSHYKDDLQAWEINLSEETLELDFEGIKLRGKIDLMFTFNKGWIVADHKSYLRSDKSQLAGWRFRFQFMFYLWIIWKIYGKKPKSFMVNAIKKPELKQSAAKNESLESFLVRIEQDMIQTPDKYFQRHNLLLTEGALERFEERTLRPKLHRIHLLTQDTTPDILIDTLVRNMNTQTCSKYGHVCPFLPICENSFAVEGFQYVERQNKHEELDGE